MFRQLIFVLFLLIAILPLKANEPGGNSRRNAVHFSVTPPLVSGMYILTLERELLSFDNGFLSAMAHGGFVGSNMGWSGYLLALAPDLNIGNGRRFVELSPGVALLMSDQSDNNELQPWLHIGYRSQKPAKSGVFRTGIGYPTIIYIGYGFRF